MITQIIRKPFFCVTDVRAIRKVIPGKLLCLASSQKVPFGGTQITQNDS